MKKIILLLFTLMLICFQAFSQASADSITINKIGGGDPNWALAGIGAGLAVVGLTLAFHSDNLLKSSVEIYNSSYRHTYLPERTIEFQLGLHSNGLGLLVRF
jgi:hypothetical protein